MFFDPFMMSIAQQAAYNVFHRGDNVVETADVLGTLFSNRQVTARLHGMGVDLAKLDKLFAPPEAAPERTSQHGGSDRLSDELQKLTIRASDIGRVNGDKQGAKWTAFVQACLEQPRYAALLAQAGLTSEKISVVSPAVSSAPQTGSKLTP